MKKIIIFDDDKLLSEQLVSYLSMFNMALLASERVAGGIELIEKYSPDLILLDVMLPDKDGFTFCKEIRERYSLPIIMLTARGDLTDRVLGLEIGADDYIAKPFEPRELVARINAQFRRGVPKHDVEKKWAFGGLDIYYEGHKALLDGVELNLTGMEFRLLVLLAKSPGMVFSRDDLLNEIKGFDSEIFSRSVDILLSRLRSKLNDNAQKPRFIKTIRNMGYCFIAQRN